MMLVNEQQDRDATHQARPRITNDCSSSGSLYSTAMSLDATPRRSVNRSSDGSAGSRIEDAQCLHTLDEMPAVVRDDPQHLILSESEHHHPRRDLLKRTKLHRRRKDGAEKELTRRADVVCKGRRGGEGVSSNRDTIPVRS